MRRLSCRDPKIIENLSMIVKYCFSSFFKSLAFAALLAAAPNVLAAKTAKAAVDSIHDPWSFNLTLYMWFPGSNGDFSAGPLSESVDLSFIDIAGKLRSFPAAFNGHLEAHYERLGFYLDGNYLGLESSDSDLIFMIRTVALASRVENWRAHFRFRWLIHDFRHGPQSGYHNHVSSSRLVERSMRFSRTTLSCLFLIKVYVAYLLDILSTLSHGEPDSR